MSPLSPKFETLPNGLQLVLIDLPGWHSITNFLVIRSGSRYENKANNGIAHFLEHMVFKGTKKYPNTLAVAEAIEGVGGYFNAWTANDHTAYWNSVPISAWRIGTEMPFELAFEALLRPEDLERERAVIIEEIKRMRDDPSSFVDDLLGEVLFPNHPLGQSVIGSEKNIQSMSIEQFNDYRLTYYHPSQALFVAVGNITGQDIRSAVIAQTKDLKASSVTRPKRFESSSISGLNFYHKKTDQTHFMLGMANPTLVAGGPQNPIGVVLNAVLGTGMSSRLFLNIREKKGLAYAISSSFHSFEDTGLIQIYGGVNTEKVDQTLAALDEELSRLATDIVSDEEFAKTKALIVGSLDMSADRPIDLARWYGVARLLGDEESIEQAKKKILAVTAESIRDLAKIVFAKKRQTLAVIGPYENDRMFREFLGLSSVAPQGARIKSEV